MSPTTRVVRNRIFIDDRVYDASALGGGKFDVTTSTGLRVGAFQIRGRAVEAEDAGLSGAHPVALIGQLWVGANLSPLPEHKPPTARARVAPSSEADAASIAPTVPRSGAASGEASPHMTPAALPSDPGRQQAPAIAPAIKAKMARSICRVATHDPPNTVTLQRACAYHEWLRGQPGVLSSYLSREPKTGKLTSVSVWATEEEYAAMRYKKPPRDASPLTSVTVDVMEVVG